MSLTTAAFNQGVEQSALVLDNTRADFEQILTRLKSGNTHSNLEKAEVASFDERVRLLTGQAMHIRNLKQK